MYVCMYAHIYVYFLAKRFVSYFFFQELVSTSNLRGPLPPRPSAIDGHACPRPRTIGHSQIAPIPLVLLRLLPASAAEQEALRMDTKRSATGGAAFVLVLVGSLAWTVAEAVYVLTADADEAG